MAEVDELTDALAASLDADEITDLRRLSGGASRETWRFRADGRDLVVQRQRAGDERDMMVEASVVGAAGEAGVRVPELLTAERLGDGTSFMVLEAIEGETIARKIQRDPEFEAARDVVVGQFGEALARIHSMPVDAVDGLEPTDPITAYTEQLDELGQPHPVLELVRRWLIEHRPPSREPAIVHGDFRLGNMIIGHDGLNAVIDWELAHLADPMEDLGWLCVKAWRFGQEPPVGGLGSRERLFEAYERSSGRPIDPDVVFWWEVVGTWKWAIMCIRQAHSHRSGDARSHELAAIGRRVCENEHDLLVMLEDRW